MNCIIVQNKRNFLDFFVYVLAWIAIPFFLFSIIGVLGSRSIKKSTYLISGKSWKERRRKNLYLFLEFCFFIILLLLLVYLLNYLFTHVHFSNQILLLGIWSLGFSIVILSLRGFWLLMALYEKSVKTRHGQNRFI